MSTTKYTPLVELVKKHLREGNQEQAKRVAEHLVDKHPQALEGWLFMGVLSHPDQRQAYLSKAYELAPEDPRVKQTLAWAQEQARLQSQSSENDQHIAKPFFDSHQVSALVHQLHFDQQQSPSTDITWLMKLNQNSYFRGFLHLGKKAVLIATTIFIGVFLTITIMNRPVVTGIASAPPQLDTLMARQIEKSIEQYVRDNRDFNNLPEHEQQALIKDLRAELVNETGLNLPIFQRHLKWTYNALKFDWGRIRTGEYSPFSGIGRQQRSLNLNEIILEYLPNTLLLVCSAYLLVFLLGLPLALMLSRKYGRWYDKLFSFFAAFSSIPSWVYGILLIAIFAFELKILPTGRMYGTIPQGSAGESVLIVMRHMILPVSAIFLSIFFNLVYSWRTFFITFSSEDYVELGKAIGLSNRKLQRDFILKPSLSYVITSFSLMFVTFWQMTMALEVVFNWPGLGWLYVVRALPNLWGENIYPGDLVIALSLVVMFAYLMGSIVLILDLVYVIVDPRIRFSKQGNTLRLKKQKQHPLAAIKGLFQTKRVNQASRFHTLKTEAQQIPNQTRGLHRDKFSQGESPRGLAKLQIWKWLKRASAEVLRYPSAIVGFIIIGILILGSLVAVIFLPYEKIGDEWSHTNLVGQPKIPKLAKPTWINLFQKQNYLSTLILDSNQGDGDLEITQLNGDTSQIMLTFSFDYNYADFPSDMFLYLSSNFEKKRAFATIFLKTPDGREHQLKPTDIGSVQNYDFIEGVPYRRMVTENPNWDIWFNITDVTQNPPYMLLFADPDQEEPVVLQGQYELKIEGFTFEEGSDIQAELVLLGQVYGAAGTDFYRRDLIVPLLWGMPFALLIGLGGALFTTIISMAMAATGVWFGGWVDNLVQRLIDVNLVLPILAIAVMAYAFLGISVWTILIVYVFLNAFGTPTKNFRAAFLQIKDAPYIEAAKAYGARNNRIILKYMVPRLIPVLVPQLVILIPAFVFLEATLGFFNIRMLYPTWGTVIYQAAMRGGLFGSRFWMLQPIALLLLTGLGFSLFGFALERILNPRLSED
jgi:peptide/nickel transport system permease protein